MSTNSRQSIDRALDSLKDLLTDTRKRGQRRPRSLKSSFAWLAGAFAAMLLAVLLPFFLLIKVATSLYIDSGAYHWLAITAGMVASGIVLLLYTQYVARRIGMGRILTGSAGRFATVLVLAYCAYGLLYISAANTKTDQVASTYTRLHPILRLSLSTWLLIDRNAVLTDTEREVADYNAMGLSPRERSLHYRQTDGYGHAVDLRTIGRSRFRNALMAGYFRAIGFRTLRHVGTADHLHVSLPFPSD